MFRTKKYFNYVPKFLLTYDVKEHVISCSYETCEKSIE